MQLSQINFEVYIEKDLKDPYSCPMLHSQLSIGFCSQKNTHVVGCLTRHHNHGWFILLLPHYRFNDQSGDQRDVIQLQLSVFT